MRKYTDNKPVIIGLLKFLDKRGNLSFIEEFQHVPLKITRNYWMYDMPGGEVRGGHAYKKNEEFIIALSGSFEIHINDRIRQQTFLLNRSYYGLYVPEGAWREMVNFSTNSLTLVLASIPYNVDDYIYDYREFKNYTHANIQCS